MKKKEIWLHDVEVYKNCFICSVKNYKTKEIITWEVSNRKNQYEEFKKWWISTKDFIISFNGVSYDNSIILYALKNPSKDNNIENFNLDLKKWSDYNIKNDFWEKDHPQYKYHNQWTDIDLFLFWSKGLRISKKINLKSLAIQLNWNEIQELPYVHTKILNENEIDELIRYNTKNDLGILDKLTDIFLGKTDVSLGNLGTIQLRDLVSKKYNINAYSYDPPKIASEVLCIDYCKKTNKNLKEFKNTRFKKEIFQFKNLFKNYNFYFKTKIFKDIYNEWMESYNSFSKEFIAFTKDKNKGIKISVGNGGIHSILENEIYESKDDYLIWDLDVQSYYPSSIMNLNCLRFPEMKDQYNYFIQDRINNIKPNIKKHKGTDKEQYWKNEDAFAKVILNGVSGLIDMEYSPLYNNKGAMLMRCFGQILLCLLTEKILEENVQIIQINTDGLSVYIHKDKIEIIRNIVFEIEKLYNYKFEEKFYKKMIFQNVNSYLAIDEDNKVKQKGEFITNPDLGNSTDELIIAKALCEYFINGTKIEDFIKNHKNIFDFCISQKVHKSYDVFWTDSNFETIKCQNVNRYYASKKGGYIRKVRNGQINNLLVDSGVNIYNKHLDIFPDDINYNYYIKKTLEKKIKIEPLQNKLLF